MNRADTTLEEAPPAQRSGEWVPTLRLLFSVDRIAAGAAVELRAGETLVGRGVGAGGVLLDDAHASRLHARIVLDSARRRAVVVNESRRGTEVDGVRAERAEPGDGAVIVVGHSALLLRWEPRPAPADVPAEEFLGGAPAMVRLRALLPVLGPTGAVVTLQGETGTGKEVYARALHAASRRRGAFVAVNCAAIPEHLAESQLFGHVQGAFTGARGPADGFFRAASEGTLFLDEVGELEAGVQAKLLRALETGAVVPVGAFREAPHGARVLTATHRDLLEDVRAGRFRADLYARISDFVVALPPLRARREDVLPLFAQAFGERLPAMEFALARALVLHPWPFNVREVVRLARQLRIHASAAPGPLTYAAAHDALARTGALSPSTPAPPSALPPPPGAPSTPAPPPALAAEREGPPARAELKRLLTVHRGVVSDLARAVGRSRKQVYRWIEAHGIDPEAFRERG